MVKRQIPRVCDYCKTVQETTSVFAGYYYYRICDTCHNIVDKYERNKIIPKGKEVIINRWLGDSWKRDKNIEPKISTKPRKYSQIPIKLNLRKPFLDLLKIEKKYNEWAWELEEEDLADYLSNILEEKIVEEYENLFKDNDFRETYANNAIYDKAKRIIEDNL